MSDYVSKWHRELEIFDKVKPVIIMEGNVFDVFQYPEDGGIPVGLSQYLNDYFSSRGYTNIVFYDAIRGFYNDFDNTNVDRFALLTGATPCEGVIKAEFSNHDNTASKRIKEAITQTKQPTVVVMEFASRYISSPENMEQKEIDSFTILTQASLEASAALNEQRVLLNNLMVIIVNKINDLPTWFYIDNPSVKSIVLRTPSKEEREQFVKGDNFADFFNEEVYRESIELYKDNPAELEKVQDKFVGLTEGFTFIELNELKELTKNQGLDIAHMCDVTDLYKFGVKDNPWKSLDHEKIKKAYEQFKKRVKGQDVAITKTMDVIKRAVTGMSGLQSSSESRPKGVLFFAGSTGTGKTETAKTLAEILFGDEKNCIRFDMSEYGQPQSDQKLLGAPPGYVGYEAGGQLTNAVKKNPFSILLFDEIEKADPSILDKFLQILEDGRMTDGQGNTVYFSECIIIFTSNLGIYEINDYKERVQKVFPSMNYEEVQKNVRKGIEDYFKLYLGRPEILNRIGENIVVFDFIRDTVAEEILNAQIEKIENGLKASRNIDVTVLPEAKKTLKELAAGNLENGGRGIGNIVECAFINPLSRYLFDKDIKDNSKIVVTKINADSMPYSLECLSEEE